MKTLLIDNYDSFTWNLYHLVAQVIGDKPKIIKNDDPNFSVASLCDYDLVILSPGPGHPGKSKDFGICSEILAHSPIPVLGVCLGHQGLCLSEGAIVDLAPQPYHGRTSSVTHNGDRLFAGIPSPFSVVRYHSMAAYQLPETLMPLAFSSDGVLMAVKHKYRPMWGVQFHPESVSTDYGKQLMANFITLAAEFNSDNQRNSANRINGTTIPPKRELLSLENIFQIEVKKLPLRTTSQNIFETLYARSRHSFWLDSSTEGGPSGRFSIMGDASGPYARLVTHDVTNGVLTLTDNRSVSSLKTGFFEWLTANLQTIKVDCSELQGLPFDFCLGWVGYLGYEMKAECNGSKQHISEYPDASFIFSDRAIVIDHQNQELFILYLTVLNENLEETENRSWANSTITRIEGIETQPMIASTGNRQHINLSLRHNYKSYIDLIDKCKGFLKQGESYEICLTNMLSANVNIDPFAIYCKLRHVNPAPFSAFLCNDNVSVLCGSPERYMRIGNDGSVESKPIKGTRPRGKDKESDDILKSELAASEKERAENLMIVDLVRNDIGSCALVGSVQVPNLYAIETFATVHQMVSTIVGKLDQPCTAVDCIRAAFPGGSMTGAPKLRTMELIDDLEQGPRGIYSGSIGYFSLNGAADFNIVIRSMVYANGKLNYGIGGAITMLSDPEDEFEETAVKASALLRVFDTTFPKDIAKNINGIANVTGDLHEVLKY